MDCYGCCALVACSICFFIFLYRFIYLVKLGNPKDLSQKRGNTARAIKYSFTEAMLPQNKESAYLHLPTYIAGVLFHIGTFLTLFIFVCQVVFYFVDITIPQILRQVVAIILIPAIISGFSVLFKRVFSKKLKIISGPDDYISNLLTTSAQLFTAICLFFPDTAPAYYIVMTLFFLWLPFGKTRHLLYFFFARYHLGYFYGWRGTW
ncbi:MAG TPA: hypothetical protein P5523_05240 [Bacteroidales bacterium]|nr:hypothetical protein [Bacteroidales bacterium]